MRQTTVKHMMSQHDAFFIDAYGVIVDASGALPGAAAFIETLNRARYPYLIVSNDASRLPATITGRFASLGLSIPEERILTSGMLIGNYFREHELAGEPTIALGGSEARMLVAQAGGRLIAPEAGEEASIIVACDDAGLNLQSTLEQVITTAMRRLDRGLPLRLILCNPDLIYPRGQDSYGITAGTVALVIERALHTRYGGPDGPRFVGLGKPYRPIFAAATARTGAINPVMVGDQLLTDIQGAHDYKIASCLVGTGLMRVDAKAQLQPDPTYYLPAVTELE